MTKIWTGMPIAGDVIEFENRRFLIVVETSHSKKGSFYRFTYDGSTIWNYEWPPPIPYGDLGDPIAVYRNGEKVWPEEEKGEKEP